MGLNRILSPEDRIQHSIDSNAVFPCGSLLRLIYESETVGISTPARGSITMLNPNQVVEGYTITIDGIVFTFSANPNNGLPIFPSPTANIISALWVAIAYHPYLKDRIIVTPSGDALYLTAKYEGTQFDFIVNQSGTAFATSYTGAQDGVFAQTKQDYGVVVDLYVDNTPTTQRLFISPSAPPNTSANFANTKPLEKRYSGVNLFEFDLAESLFPFLKSQVPLVKDTAGFGDFGVNYALPMIARFAYIVSERWVEDGISYQFPREIRGFNYETDEVKKTFWAVRSSERLEYTDDDTYRSFYFRWRGRRLDGQGLVYPLSHQPLRKLIRRDALEFLYFVFDRPANLNLYDLLGMRVTFTLEDCTEVESFFPITAFSTFDIQNGIISIEVSPRMFDLTSYESTSKVASYSITFYVLSSFNISAPAIDLTVEQSYVLVNEDNCADNVPTLLFLNPLGGYDSLTPRGVIVKSIDVDRDNYNRTLKHETVNKHNGLPYPDYEKVTTESTYATQTTVSYSINTGWLDKDHADWLRDMVQSTEIYLVDPTMERETRTIDGWQPRRVLVRGFKWERSSLDDSYALSIEVSLTINRANLPS